MFERELEKTGLGMPFEKAVALVAVASFSLAAAELIFFFPRMLPQELLFASLSAFLPPALFCFFLDYLHARKRVELERELPGALFQIASFPRGAPVEKMIAVIAESDSGELSREFGKIKRRVDAGESVPAALQKTIGSAGSPLLSRALVLLNEGYASGADLAGPMRLLAEDSFQLQAIASESAAAMAMQKYTLLAGACFIVPAVLAMLLSMVATLSIDFAQAGGLGDSLALGRPASVELVGAFEFSMQAYLAILAALSSVFVAFSESAPRKAVLYFSLLLPASLLVFNLVRAANFG